MPMTRRQGITNCSKAKSQNASKRGPTPAFLQKLRERIVEERRGERLRSAALESFTRMPTRRPSTNYRILTGLGILISAAIGHFAPGT